MVPRRLLGVATAGAVGLVACGDGGYDPLARARASEGHVVNIEAGVPPMCYTDTGAASNPCWTCHTQGLEPNGRVDFDLQRQYAFSETARENHWTNLFLDRRAAVARIGDEEILAYVRADNYAPLRRSLTGRRDYPGYVPDLDLERGFDELGFAIDGSGWRVLRYKPFPGSFWPTNGSTDDVFIRLPPSFRSSVAVYRGNLAILEAAIAARPGVPTAALERAIEPVDERVLGLDLDGDGVLARSATRIRGLPSHYAGAAEGVAVRRYLYPEGTEFLHSVRYLDPDAPTQMSKRMKELRYARKVKELDDWAITRAYEREAEEKSENQAPVYPGSALVGLRNAFGWQLQGFIEDADGRLRLQTDEEHLFCMGCHSGIGVTVDQTFAFARKVPGAGGWRPQDLRGMPDVPQSGHPDPEVLTYLRRVGGGDELRANTEVLERFFPGGHLDEAEVLRGASGGDRDLTHLVTPSRTRALLLDKAYRALVLTQRFDLGRDAMIAPAEHVHRDVSCDYGCEEALDAAKQNFLDGRLHLDW